MEAAKPIIETITKNNEEINYIQELEIKKENKEYKIQFVVNESYNQNKMILKVFQNNSKEYYYFSNKYNYNDFQNFSKIFSLYENIKQIILFLKTLKFEITEKNNDLLLKFTVFLPNGQNQLIELNLTKCMLDNKDIIHYLIEENKLLKEDISKNKNEILSLKEENKKIWEEITKIKNANNICYNNNTNNSSNININNSFDSKIINTQNDINFILDYIKENDESIKFNNLKLLYRASRDTDKTEICHKLCDNKTNVLIIIKSDTDYIFGGYSKIGFKSSEKNQYLKDNNCFLFSYNLKNIYPVIKNKPAICHIQSTYGLCFSGSLAFYGNFMNNQRSIICGGTSCFSGLSVEINGGKKNFKCKDLEVFQLN